jgi:hypothetical protein
MKPTPFLNYKSCDTEKEAHDFANQLIGGGIIQYKNDGKWHVFGAMEFQEKMNAGEFDTK